MLNLGNNLFDEPIVPETSVVNIKKHKCDIYVGRPSEWGNKWSHIKDKNTLAEFVVGSREEAISEYEKWILTQQHLIDKLHLLKGKKLGCWCTDCERWTPQTKMICHAQVLQKLIRLKKI